MNTKVSDYKGFYKKVLLLAFPIMLQNGVSNFVSLLDNIMIGRVGTEEMSGVAIVNQLLFVFNLCIFGAISGAGIFTAQFYGQKNTKGVRDTFRFKILLSFIILAVALVVFLGFNEQLISLYLNSSDSEGDLELTLKYGQDYIYIMLIGLLPFIVGFTYSSTLRETGKTVVPMIASLIAVFINLGLNYVLIYGKFGMPVLGVKGAAIATVVARFIEAAIVVMWTHKHNEINEFIKGAYKTLLINKQLVKKITLLGLPLLINETMWAAGLAAQNQAFSVRGLDVVAAANINSTIFNVFNVVFIAMGDAVAIIVGQLLGAGKLKEAKQSSYRIIGLSVFICIITGAVLYLTAPLFPEIYETSRAVKDLALRFLRITAMVMPLMGFLHATYFTIRSGGKTIITFLFDSFFLWVVTVPIAFFLANKTSLGIVYIFLICNLIDIIKAIVGFILLKSGVWINNIVEESKNSID